MTDAPASPNAFESDKPGTNAPSDAEAVIEELLRRQKALGVFGDFVLDHEDLDEILTEGCRLVAEALGADLAKVLEIERTNDTALVRAGVGWNDGIVGKERISLSERSSEAFAIEQGEPVITKDIERETRFHFPQFLKDHGVIALVNVPVFLPGRKPWGVLQVDARETRDFEQEDIEFLKTYSMVLGPVIDRLQHVRGRKESEAKYRNLFESMEEGYLVGEVIFNESNEAIDIRFVRLIRLRFGLQARNSPANGCARSTRITTPSGMRLMAAWRSPESPSAPNITPSRTAGGSIFTCPN